ncbi:carbohydrate-binding protein [Mariniflexile gromovii]|uniref:Carbohydrate-binding protein n=1 Tax=Mariniflexile gromovii TaxID=362523 RepID=A0ABS4BZ03_9FLAO|nr:carbohydrate-binding protein [Mariniflexile gromovii]MBP0905813.1 carbohydrate-binding protein [Mariniflexile gromovii]
MKNFNRAINFCNTNFQRIAFTLIMLFFMSTSVYSDTVNSLSELIGYLDDDNVNVVMNPGTYTITTAEVQSGVYGPNPVLEFSGNNSTYDFTGVTFQFETGIFALYGWNVIMMEIQVSGNNNTLRNLTMTNLGGLQDKPDRGGTNLVVDGQDNLIENFYMTVKGSYPYGYGDAFGKGGPYTIKPFKRCAILVRGNRNHVKGCTIIHRAYGHAIYMQGADEPIIEGCYIEGEVRKTDDMLAETSGPAYDIDFMTAWGYKLPAGYMMSLGEDGIRTYASGDTKINGSYINQNTSDVTILDCTVKYMRTGVSLALGSGTRYIEGCTVLGCEEAYTSTVASFINCSADVTYGPIFKNSYEWTRNLVATFTILPPVDNYYNGSNCVAYFGGDGPNDITLNYGGGTIDPNAKIQMGGYFNGIRFFNGINEAQNDHISWNHVLNNLTNYPVHCPSTSKDSEITSCGPVDNEGSGNTISTPSSGCPGGDVNLALSGTASQSSTIASGVASRAIDGNTSGVWSESSVTHTASDANAWWEVDLGATYSIGEIKIFNRTDCCKDRLTNFTVYVLNSGGGEEFSQSYTSYPNPSITLNGNGASGRVVRVQLDNTNNHLSLAEVEVYEGEGICDDELPWSDGNISVSAATLNYSETVDISCASSATISMDIEGLGSMEPADYLNIYYKVDGGSQQVLSENVDDFSNKTVSAIVSGNSVELIMNIYNSAPAEIYNVSNIKVVGAQTSIHIEAEDYTGMNGVATQPTTDTGGGLNVGWIGVGDYMDYLVTIPTAGTYSVDYRVASLHGGGEVQFQVGGVTKATTSIAATGDYQAWTTLTTSVTLAAGTQTVRLYASLANWNINWFDITSSSSAKFSGGKEVLSVEETIENSKVSVYPNPGSSKISIALPTSKFNSYVIYDISGRATISGQIEGNLDKLDINISHLSKGIYMISLKGNQTTDTFKFIKK